MQDLELRREDSTEEVDAGTGADESKATGAGTGTGPAPNTTLTTRPVRRPRGRPLIFWRVWWFTLRDFFRSAWALLALLVLVLTHILLYNHDPTQQHFFSVQYASILLLAVVLAAGFFSRANRPETYAILARPISRAALTGGLILAAWLLSIVGHLLATAAVVVRYGPWFDPSINLLGWLDTTNFALGSLPVIAGALAAVSLVALLSSFIAPSGVRLGILAVIALLVMSFDSRNFPIEALRPALEQLPPIVAPAAGALKFATDTPRDGASTIALVVLAVYAVLLTGIVLLMSAGREIAAD